MPLKLYWGFIVLVAQETYEMETTKTPKGSLYIVTTTRCNLSCPMCWFANHRKSTPPVDMSMDLFESIVRQAVPLVNSLELTRYGEVFCDPLYRERIKVLKKYMHEKPELVFRITTNGLLLDKSRLKVLSNFKNPIAFLISFDSTDPFVYETLRSKGNFWRVIDNLESLNELTAKLNINKKYTMLLVTLFKRNLMQVPKIIHFAKKIGATVYLRHAVSEFGTPLADRETLFRYPAFTNQFLKSCASLAEALNVPLIREPDFATTDEEIAIFEKEAKEKSRHCMRFKSRVAMHIQADGSFLPCCSHSRVIGNVKDTTLEKLLTFGSNQYTTNFLSKEIPGCFKCWGMASATEYLHDATNFGIKLANRDICYEPDIDLVKCGFYDYLAEIDSRKMRKLVYANARRETSDMEKNLMVQG